MYIKVQRITGGGRRAYEGGRARVCARGGIGGGAEVLVGR
jgi:hypothetical protein